MTASINKTTLLGYLGGAPDIRTTQSGNKVASFSLATSENWKDKASGEKKERTEWHRVVVFNDHLCTIAGKYLKKGSRVYIEGALHTRKWAGDDGVDRYTTEVVLQNYGAALVLLDKKHGGGYPPPADDLDGYGKTETPEFTADEYRRASGGDGQPATDDRAPF